MAEETVDLPLGTALVVLPWPMIRRTNGTVPKETYLVVYSEQDDCKELASISPDALHQLRPDLWAPLGDELGPIYVLDPT